MTGIPLSSAAGEMGPFQLIIQGKTDRTFQPMQALIIEPEFAGWNFTYSENHRSNLETMKEFVSELLVPWLQDNIKALKLPEDQKAVALMDCWSVHNSQAFRTWWKEKYPWLLFLYIPAVGLFVPSRPTGSNLGTDEVLSGSEGEGSPPGSEGEAEDDSGDESDEGDADGTSAVQDAAGSDHDTLLTQIAARIAAQLEARNEDRSAKKQRGQGAENAALQISGLELGGLLGSLSSGAISRRLLRNNNGSTGNVGLRVQVVWRMHSPLPFSLASSGHYSMWPGCSG
ncbi:hypothetical protein WJX75_009771 [Coccomyxa subellipsoidea]|uniref:DDE-1 domain-containing protein n=1 Tax=Coccomyxa subellipsoidea TaxID=248742 RepID=A0ABR2YWA9_9CHLO